MPIQTLHAYYILHLHILHMYLLFVGKPGIVPKPQGRILA